MGLKSTNKCFVDGVLAIFDKKSPTSGTLLTFRKILLRTTEFDFWERFSFVPIFCAYIWCDKFFDQGTGKLVEIKKNPLSFYSPIFHQGSSHFFYLINVQNFELFVRVVLYNTPNST